VKTAGWGGGGTSSSRRPTLHLNEWSPFTIRLRTGILLSDQHFGGWTEVVSRQGAAASFDSAMPPIPTRAESEQTRKGGEVK